eukprot:CAMPEP_0174236226 /NCGR_PEP_ID=MMETSP0417-20130205/5421_1 /TAXON_ID=242541 /ORGANISM="Mayorella sp, Strain BSH-02190019" /LENGTH=347 /DNA_ID=CAMNT_0015314837 /DNA_START=83 /DNA_END=1123 /DNA_ORIENTATION=+
MYSQLGFSQHRVAFEAVDPSLVVNGVRVCVLLDPPIPPVDATEAYLGRLAHIGVTDQWVSRTQILVQRTTTGVKVTRKGPNVSRLCRAGTDEFFEMQRNVSYACSNGDQLTLFEHKYPFRLVIESPRQQQRSLLLSRQRSFSQPFELDPSSPPALSPQRNQHLESATSSKNTHNNRLDESIYQDEPLFVPLNQQQQKKNKEQPQQNKKEQQQQKKEQQQETVAPVTSGARSPKRAPMFTTRQDPRAGKRKAPEPGELAAASSSPPSGSEESAATKCPPPLRLCSPIPSPHTDGWLLLSPEDDEREPEAEEQPAKGDDHKRKEGKPTAQRRAVHWQDPENKKAKAKAK